jgi:anti-anti-sigma factor
MRLPLWLCLPFLRLAGVVRRAGRPLPARGYARIPGPRRARALAEQRPRPVPWLEIEVIEAGFESAVWLRGEADVGEAAGLEAALSRLLAKRPTCVIFDLSELRSVSSLAVGVLATFRRAAARAGVRVCRATALRPAVHETLGRAGLLDLFEAVGQARPSEKDARHAGGPEKAPGV